ncbi:MAG: hypothetical protein WCO56_00505 [Verrucomicrobiota bacterium]
MLFALAGFITGCAGGGHVIRVVDASSGKPVAGATVSLVYPSVTSTPYLTDERGLAHIDERGFGKPGDALTVQVFKPGYASNAFGMWGVVKHRLEVRLQPAATP